MIYAFDSNIISYILKKDKGVSQKYNEEYLNGADFVIPPQVYFEVKRGLKAINAVAQLKNFEFMCSQFLVGESNISMLEKAIEIYVDLKQTGMLIEDADILIAAYCIINDYTLITNNTSHFERVKDLKHVNWK